MELKKLLLSLGTIGIVTTPIVAVISCQNEDDKKTNSPTNKINEEDNETSDVKDQENTEDEEVEDEGTEILISSKKTMDIDNLFPTKSAMFLLASEVNDKLGISKFNSNDLSSVYFLSRMFLDPLNPTKGPLMGVYYIARISKAGEQFTDPSIFSTFDPKKPNYEFEYFIFKSSNTNVQKLDRPEEEIKKFDAGRVASPQNPSQGGTQGSITLEDFIQNDLPKELEVAGSIVNDSNYRTSVLRALYQYKSTKSINFTGKKLVFWNEIITSWQIESVDVQNRTVTLQDPDDQTKAKYKVNIK